MWFVRRATGGRFCFMLFKGKFVCLFYIWSLPFLRPSVPLEVFTFVDDFVQVTLSNWILLFSFCSTPSASS
jgi:hypothetical protein